MHRVPHPTQTRGESSREASSEKFLQHERPSAHSRHHGLTYKLERARMPETAPPADLPDLPKTKQPHGRAAALAVATGILLSKLIGLIRERIFAHYFGNSMAADAFKAAFRIPNMLQNLFGEGVLSASFIPVYARLNAEERHEEATRTAAAIFAILVFVASALVLLGVLFAPALVDIIAYGFKGETRLLTIQLVRILFPWRGPARALGLVPRHPQQPPPILPLLHRPRGLERSHDRDPHLAGTQTLRARHHHRLGCRAAPRRRPGHRLGHRLRAAVLRSDTVSAPPAQPAASGRPPSARSTCAPSSTTSSQSSSAAASCS